MASVRLRVFHFMGNSPGIQTGRVHAQARGLKKSPAA
jgi:hypothetical protein